MFSITFQFWLRVGFDVDAVEEGVEAPGTQVVDETLSVVGWLAVGLTCLAQVVVEYVEGKDVEGELIGEVGVVLEEVGEGEHLFVGELEEEAECQVVVELEEAVDALA